jgi:hypothetical protein
MGRPLNEPTKVLGVIPFSDALIIVVILFLDGLLFILMTKKFPFLPSFVLTASIFLGVIIAALLKNIFPRGFFRGMLKFHVSPRVKIPGRERSEI